jgi:DNA replication protein DnaC
MTTLKQSDEEQLPCPYEDSVCIKCGAVVKPWLYIGLLNKNKQWRKPSDICNECKIKEEDEEKRKEEEVWENKRFISYGLSPINKTMTFENFKVNNKNKLIYEFIREYSEKLDKNIFLTGRCGNGKTHLASALAMKLFTTRQVIDKEHNIWSVNNFKFVVVPELLMKIRDTFKKDSEYSELDIIERYTETPFLFLDDFGAEKISEWTLEAIFLLLDTRIRDMKPFFITSNLSISEIGQRFNDRIASRIAGECSILELTDIDHRLKK